MTSVYELDSDKIALDGFEPDIVVSKKSHVDALSALDDTILNELLNYSTERLVRLVFDALYVKHNTVPVGTCIEHDEDIGAF